MVETSEQPAVKCACPSCQCPVPPDRAVLRDGKVFCSVVCAHDCTETTCVCIHENCGTDDSAPKRHT